MRTMRAAMAAVLAAGLSGCIRPPAPIGAVCQSYGYPPGSALFLQCIQGVAASRQRAAAMSERAFEYQMRNEYHPYDHVAPPPQQVTCNRIGTYTYCN